MKSPGQDLRRPRGLFIQRTIPPDHSAAGRLVMELASALVARHGFEVDIVATRVPEDAAPSEVRDGVRVLRAASGGYSRRGSLARSAAILRAHPALFCKSRRLPRPTLVVSLSDPPLAALTGHLTARRFRCPHIHWSQDLYPEVAEAAGIFRSHGMVANVLRGLSNFALRRAELVLAPGRCMVGHLLERRGLDAGRVRFFPNWVNAGLPAAKREEVHAFRADGGARNKDFLLVYAGNFGVAHEFDTFLRAARLLRDSHNAVRFLFVGDGSRRGEIERAIRRDDLSNVRLAPPCDFGCLGSLLAAGDAHLMSLDAAFHGLVVPSKIYNVLAAERPVVYAGPADGEPDRLIREFACGLRVAPGDAGALAEWVVRSAATGAGMGCEAPEVVARFSVEAAADRFAEAARQVSVP